MRIGVSSSCLYPQYTEQAVRQLLENGVKTLEVFVNSPSEMSYAYLKELRRLADGYGAAIVSLHPYTSGMEGLLFFTEYKRRFQDGLDLYKAYFEGVQLLGGEIVVFHGGHKDQKISLPAYFERFDCLQQTAKSMGARLCHENVERSLGRSPDFFIRMKQALPDARFVYDVKQAVRSGYDPFEMFDAMGDRIAHVHLSDHNDTQDCLPPGTGNLDTRLLMGKLLNCGFNGSVVVELYFHNFSGVQELVNSNSYIENILDTFTKLST